MFWPLIGALSLICLLTLNNSTPEGAVRRLRQGDRGEEAVMAKQSRLVLDDNMVPEEVHMLLTAIGFVEEIHDTRIQDTHQNGRACRSRTESWTLATATTVVCLRHYVFKAGDTLLEGEFSAEVWDNPTGKVMA